MEKVRNVLISFLKEKTSSLRQLAAIAGKMISLSASLYFRTQFQALQLEKLSSDEIFATPKSVRSTVKEWLENLPV
jgi:hypothetical protein